MATSSVHGEGFDSEKYLVFALGRLSLRPQLEVAGTFDSNLFFAEEDVVSDFITTVRPGLSMVYGERDANYVSLRYTLDGAFYATRNDLDNLGHWFNHQSSFAFTRLRVQASDRFAVTKALLGGSFSYIQRRVGQVSLGDDWRIDYDLAPKVALGAQVNFDLVDYDSKDLQPFHLYDYMSYRGALRAGYRPSDKITVFPEVSASQTFLSRNSPTARVAPDLNAFGFAVGAEGEFTPKLTGRVAGGYELRAYEDNSEIPDGWVATAQLRWQARAKTAVTLGYRHWVLASREVTGYSYTVDRMTLSLSQEIGTQGRWSAGLDGYYQFDDYDQPFLVGGQPVRRRDSLAGASLRTTYRWKPWLAASASYDFLAYNNNIETIPNYDVHRLTLRLAAGY